MYKGYKMRQILLLILPIYLFAIVNPYKTLAVDEKLNVMVNYFLNEELKTKLPLKPIKEILKDDGASLEPVKYEYYFSYIQRIKAIRESRAAEQKEIDEKYAGKVGFYNGKVNVLKNFYDKQENLAVILQNSINKAFKVIYGIPKIKDVTYDKKTSTIVGVLYSEDVYSIEKFEDKKITIEIPTKVKYLFLENYKDSIVKVQLEYKENLLKLQKINIEFQENDYKATFIENSDKSFKLNIKIDEEIFKPIQIKGTK
jgi:predicted metallopeptidase